MLVDTHAHLYKEYYEDISKVLEDSYNLGISHVISDADNYESGIEMLELSNKYKNVYITLGFHPEFEEEYNDNFLNFLEENIDNKKVIAIGEIGLDYHYENHNKEKQKIIFREQLKIAEKHNIPIVVHSREATEDTINILKEYNVKGVIHAFSGSVETAEEYIKMGYKLGVGGVVTFNNCHIKEVIKKIGIENIVLETDSPYLTPVPFRGKTNIPGYVKYIAEFLSNYLNISIEEIEKITNKNVIDIFPKFDF